MGKRLDSLSGCRGIMLGAAIGLILHGVAVFAWFAFR